MSCWQGQFRVHLQCRVELLILSQVEVLWISLTHSSFGPLVQSSIQGERNEDCFELAVGSCDKGKESRKYAPSPIPTAIPIPHCLQFLVSDPADCPHSTLPCLLWSSSSSFLSCNLCHFPYCAWPHSIFPIVVPCNFGPPLSPHSTVAHNIFYDSLEVDAMRQCEEDLLVSNNRGRGRGKCKAVGFCDVPDICISGKPWILTGGSEETVNIEGSGKSSVVWSWEGEALGKGSIEDRRVHCK
jgi:hypothetical protein